MSKDKAPDLEILKTLSDELHAKFGIITEDYTPEVRAEILQTISAWKNSMLDKDGTLYDLAYTLADPQTAYFRITHKFLPSISYTINIHTSDITWLEPVVQ
jgi:hypothetical protein